MNKDPWHERLLAVLSDCGVQRAPRYPFLNYFLAIAVMMGTISIAALISYGIERSARFERDVLAWIGYPLLILFVILVLSRVRNFFLRRAWQSSARSAEEEIKRDRSRRPILYLRSFALDQHLAKPSWSERILGTRPFANAEQNVTRELRKLGPVIAIGRPGEKLPALGAARFYVAHDRWQEKVALIVKESQLVLWATGETEGLRWELSHLVDNLEPNRIVLWAHPSLIPGSVDQRESAWRKFCNTLGNVFPKPLPSSLGSARFFKFDQDWNSIPYAARSLGFLVPRHVSALRQAVNIPPSQHPRLWMTWDISRILIGIATIVGVIGIATTDIARQWDLGVIHAVDFWIGALAIGGGVAMLAAGIAGLCKRRLKLALTWSIVPIIAVLCWLMLSMIASPMYWRPIESERWKKFANDPSKVDEYLQVPSRFKRIEAYPLIVERLGKRILQTPEGYAVSYRFDDLIEEIERRSKSYKSLIPVKDRLIELETMTARPGNLRELPPSYFRLWTKYLETSKELSDQEKSKRAREILGELSSALPDDAETKLLKAKLQALSVDVYPQLVASLVTQILRSPYDPNFEIRRNIERLLKEVTDQPQSDASLNSFKDTLLELKAMIPVTTNPPDLPPIYFQLWTKYLETSNELSQIEKSKRAADVLRELELSWTKDEEILKLRPRLYGLTANPAGPSN